MNELWKGLNKNAQQQLSERDYRPRSLGERISQQGIDVGELLAIGKNESWIPGVDIFPRRIYPQRHRGCFGELGRENEGLLGQIKLWPKQWATARMHGRTAKGFHIHPPHVPEGESPGEWFKRLYITNPMDYSARPYDKEQWDVMFFIQGSIELILVDEREGLDRKVMRMFIEGDNYRNANNAAVVIPAGVAHALRAESSEDVVMVYGTSTVFTPAFEGRIASEVEIAQLPEGWASYLEE